MGTRFRLSSNVVVLALSAAFMLTYIYRFDIALAISREDGVIEWATTLLYLIATVVFLVAARRFGFRNVWLLGLGLMCFFVAGEEISWGQRVIGVDTPEAIGSRNVQDELNLHNIEGVHQNIRMVGAGIVSLLFFVIPITDAVMPSLRRLYTRWRVPIFPAWFILTPLIALLFMVVPRLGGGLVFELDEFGEILLSLAFLVYALTAAATAPTRRSSAASTVGADGAQPPVASTRVRPSSR